MRLQIKSYLGSVLFEAEANSLRELLLGAVKSGANLSGANLRSANLSGADLRSADLSGAAGLPDTCSWFLKNFKATKQGVIVYKCFGGSYPANSAWKIEPGAVLSENCNPCPVDDCGCGINVATKAWVLKNHPNREIWRCLIRWSWLPGVVIPWNTDGKLRCSKLQLIRKEID